MWKYAPLPFNLHKAGTDSDPVWSESRDNPGVETLHTGGAWKENED